MKMIMREEAMVDLCENKNNKKEEEEEEEEE